MRKGQRTNQKYRDLVGSDQQMQKLEKTELRKADRTVGVNCNIFYPIFRQAQPDFFRVPRTVSLSKFSFFVKEPELLAVML